MAIPLKNLTTTKRKHPPVLAVYGTGGVGKTSLAAEFPNPLYLFTEGEEPPTGIDLTTPMDEDGEPKPITSYLDLMDPETGYIAQMLNEEHDFKTLIIDSLDSFERFVWEHTCKVHGFETIDSNDKGSPTAFGKGYLAADEFWNEYMSAVRAVARSGVHVVQILHNKVKAFNDPMVDSYDRYRPKLQDRATDIIMEKSEALLFINKRASIKQVEKAFGKDKAKAEGMSGAERVIYTDERAGFLAKNRLNMPPSIIYRKGQGFAELSKYFYSTETKAAA